MLYRVNRPRHGDAIAPSRQEFFERLPIALRVKVPWTQRDALFRMIDRDGDGVLDFDRDFYPTFRRHTAAGGGGGGGGGGEGGKAASGEPVGSFASMRECVLHSVASCALRPLLLAGARVPRVVLQLLLVDRTSLRARSNEPRALP